MKASQILIVQFSITVVTTATIIIQNGDQHEGDLSNSQVNLSFNKSLNINEGTICLQFYLLGSLGRYVLLSAVAKKSFSLSMFMDYNYGFFHLQGRKSILYIIPNVWPFEWFHFCLTYKDDGYLVVTNGKIWDSKPITVRDDDKYYYIENMRIGSLVTDGANKHVFPGRISGLNIWNYTMTVDELKTVTTSCSKLQKQPNIVNWSTVNKNQFSIANAKYINEDEGMCSAANKVKVKLYLALNDYETAKHICKIMGAEMYFPKTKDELTIIHNDSSFSHQYSQCANNALILPIHLNDQGEWEDLHGKVLSSTQLKWYKGEPNGSGRQRCVVTTKEYSFYDVFCYSKFCHICKWAKNPVFFLKGLCPQSNIEYRYVLKINELYHGNLAFKGFSNDYYIVYDIRKQTYVIAKSINFEDQNIPIDDDKIIGVSSSGSNSMSIGVQTWKLYDGMCNETIKLKLTSVRLYLLVI